MFKPNIHSIITLAIADAIVERRVFTLLQYSNGDVAHWKNGTGV
jgi:hypothetical protein